jgi:hypothetical protein
MLLDGHTHTSSSGVAAGAIGLTPAIGMVTHRGVAVTDTARLLAPPPLPPSRTGWYVWIAVLAAYCLCWAGLGVATWPDTSAEDGEVSRWGAIAGPAVLASPGLIALVLVAAALIRRRRKDQLWRRVTPYFGQLHERAWYCRRCAGAFFLPGTVPDHVPTGTLIPIADFRDTVWMYSQRQREAVEQAHKP